MAKYVLMPVEPTDEMLTYIDEAAWIDLLRVASKSSCEEDLKGEVSFLLDRLNELVPEWPNGRDCKSLVLKHRVSSNLT